MATTPRRDKVVYVIRTSEGRRAPAPGEPKLTKEEYEASKAKLLKAGGRNK